MRRTTISNSCVSFLQEVFETMPDRDKSFLKSGAKLLMQHKKSYTEVVEKQKTFEKFVKQIAHDMRSYISSMAMGIEQLRGAIPENEHGSLLNNITDMSDMVEQLSQYDVATNSSNAVAYEIILIPALLSLLINDSRYNLKNGKVKFEFELTALNAFTFIKVIPNHFKRAVINLINNAVDAMPESGGLIKLKLTATDNYVNISIWDNGVGIPEDMLAKIKDRISVTHGKGEKGHGVGMTQIMDMLSGNHGDIEIFSSTREANHGTTINLRFPRVLNPSWICEKIILSVNAILLVLDDDEQVHKMWDSRLSHIVEKIPDIKIKYFSSGAKLIDYIEDLSVAEKEDIYLLCDYKLPKQELNGLQVIAKSKIKNSILVTKYYTYPEVKKAAMQDVVVKILPQEFINIIPIAVAQEATSYVDMVFVDDTPCFTKNLVAIYYKNLIIDQYSNPIEFLSKVSKYPKNTRFILDNYYFMADHTPYDIDGITMAKQLHEMGYTNLILLSGEEFNVPDYLQLVLKTDQEALSKLDQTSKDLKLEF